ncbi:Tripartite tricarboxylate transporter family receptor [Pigmentiphaga humi]|uniref:Tripartite tricarboxylate transporter family receptor n=1 Tax=Pigmentiphaga humi TaxID=2478468 RepID=A0A3P4AVS4_9BURK|nr:tripartite tricarboxylate transporter substrate binding protein [Pigmentiphaga humi]VCU68139.1 Tripartite tricarboxylate transporter family receptor [Pigmentiphaga humi]
MPSTSLIRAALAAAALLATSAAAAQPAYPAKPITLVHGFGAGGNADVVARLMARKLQEALGQPVVVEIKTGAGGAIATDYAAKAAPDGYTLVMLTGAHTVTGALRKNLPYDSVKDFAFISTVSSFPFVVAVRAEHPARTLKELLDSAKKGQVTFSSVGVGSTQHMVGELLGASAGVPLQHIPYRGGGAPIQAVLAGDVDVLSDTLTVATPHIESGKLRALAVTSAAEWPSMPGVPPVSATLPGFEVRSWLGLAAPAGTPEPIVQRLNAETRKALASADVQQALGRVGSLATPSSPAEMQDRVRTEIERWNGVIKARQISVD